MPNNSKNRKVVKLAGELTQIYDTWDNEKTRKCFAVTHGDGELNCICVARDWNLQVLTAGLITVLNEMRTLVGDANGNTSVENS